MRLWWRWVMVMGLLLGAGYGGTWIAAHQGLVQVELLGYRLSTPLWVVAWVVAMLVLGAVLLVWGWMRMRLWRATRADGRHGATHQRAIEAVTDVIASLSCGDVGGAQQALRLTQKTLGEAHPLHQLCALHVAAKTGEGGVMHASLHALHAHPTTRCVASHSLMKEALQAEHRVEALGYAKEAYLARPHHAAMVIDYSALLLLAGEWAEAQRIITLYKKQRSVLSKAQWQRLQAVAYVMQYQQSGEEGLLPRALALAPSFAPAYVAISDYMQHNAPHKAWKWLQVAWKAHPHPELTDIFLHYFADLPAAKVMKYAESLCALHPEHHESHVMMAEIAMRMGQYDRARNHLKAALAIAPQRRVYHLLARLEEEGYHDEKAAKSWLQKLTHAQPDPAWSCTACGHVHEYWQLECTACHRFMTVEFGELPAFTHAPIVVSPL